MVSAGIQPTLLLYDGAEKFSFFHQVTNRPKQFSAQLWWFNFELKLLCVDLV